MKNGNNGFHKSIPTASDNDFSYSHLYQAWKNELERKELQPIDKEVYSKLGQYIHTQREELQGIDENSLKAHLLAQENKRMRKLFNDLVRSRYRKIFITILGGGKISTEFLTSEEEITYSGIISTWKHTENIIDDVLKGKKPRVKELKLEEPKRILVRFLQAIPTIVGPDMKTYGPFKEEDVAYLPAENAKALLRRRVVAEVED